MHIQDAAVILHLRFRLKPDARQAFFDYMQDAFPVFEAACDCKGVAYVDAQDADAIDEVFYYRTEADYRTAERLLSEDAAHAALITRWRALLDGAPSVEVQRRLTP